MADAPLFLVPTEFERAKLSLLLEGNKSLSLEDGPQLHLCGFGPIVAAARTAQLIATLRPPAIVLLGIAGSFDAKRAAIGKAYAFENVACYGVGVGTGKHFQSAADLGWDQWPNSSASRAEDMVSGIRDALPLHVPTKLASEDLCETLLTVTSASANLDDVQDRLQAHSSSAAEEMEAFAVAAACHLNRIPLTVIRGISNSVGERDKRHWQVDAALNSVSDLVLQISP